jgi:hypothetical protein
MHDGNIGEVTEILMEKARQSNVGTDDTEDGAEQGECAGRGGGQRTTGSSRRARGRERTQIASALPADEAYSCGEYAGGEQDASPGSASAQRFE